MCVLVAHSCPTLCDHMDCIASQASLSMGFSRQEYWRRYPFLSPGDLPDPGMEPGSLALQADSLLPEPPEKTCLCVCVCVCVCVRAHVCQNIDSQICC